jgi:hypothetical protein
MLPQTRGASLALCAGISAQPLQRNDHSIDERQREALLDTASTPIPAKGPTMQTEPNTIELEHDLKPHVGPAVAFTDPNIEI